MAELQLFLLGPGRFIETEGGEIQFRGRLLQALLAYLAVESGQPHSRESLLGLLWPDMTETDARNNLRVTWSRLRKGLGRKRLGAGNDAPFLTSTRFYLQFNPDSSYWLDVAEFDSLLAASRQHAHTARRICPECCQKLAQAVELYQGDFLAGFYLDNCPAFEEWQYVQRERLQLQMLEALTDLTHFHTGNQQLSRAEQYARRQLELDPLRENAHQQLMRLLYDQGQRSAALAQYDLCRKMLIEELGVEPDAETVQLYQQMKSGSLPTPGDAAAPQGISSTSKLPQNITPFIGREKELAQLNERLQTGSYRLLSLVGPGGIGKTRLAIQAARAQQDTFRDGVFFVPLEGVQTAAEIPAAIAKVLDVAFSGGTESPQSEIVRVLHDKQLLLVLDNLEHVIEGGTELLLEIIQATPKVVVLITSRERLNMQVEDLFRLRGLPYPDTDNDPDAAQYAAVRLFADRAHRMDKAFGLSEETLSYVVQICRLVEGLPLGLELAATWVRDFSIEQIALSLEEDFGLLETDLRDISPRHRNIAAVFEHSWGLLSQAEQDILPQLAVFRGGFTLAAAQEVTGASPLALTRLRYKSLLRGSSNGRYTMHELLRQLARRKLNEQPDVAAQTQSRHSFYFLSLLQTEADRLTGEAAAQTGKALRLEIDNIRRGWRWAVESSALEHLQHSAAGLVAFFTHEGLGFEVAQLLQSAIDSPEIQSEAQADLRLQLLSNQLSAIGIIATLDEITALIERILSLSQQHPGMSHLEAEAYLIWSMSILYYKSAPKEARVYLDKALSIAAGMDNPELEARLLCESGRNYLYDGQFEEAVRVLQQALALFEALGHIPGQALVYSRLAPAYAEAYDLGPALVCDREALRLYSQINYRSRLGAANHNLAETYVLLGAYEQAQVHVLKSLEIARQQAVKLDEANTLCVYATALNRLGQTDVAEKKFGAAIKAQKDLNLNFSLRFSLLDWGDFQRQVGRLAEAEITLSEALALNNDQPYLKLTTQAKQAMVCLAQGKSRAAIALADEVWQAIEPSRGKGFPLPIDTMVECYTIFQACNDGRAKTAINLAAEVLERTAAGIDDPEMRSTFLNNVPVNRQVKVALLEGYAETSVT